jgi:hypothetical protein
MNRLPVDFLTGKTLARKHKLLLVTNLLHDDKFIERDKQSDAMHTATVTWKHVDVSEQCEGKAILVTDCGDP